MQTQVQAYQNTHKMVMSDREVEAAVLTEGALMLRNCQENWTSGGNNGMLDEALRYNQLVWSILSGEITRKDHPMPRDLRQKILTLSRFIDRRIFGHGLSPLRKAQRHHQYQPQSGRRT